jgi:hypothetical protein
LASFCSAPAIPDRPCDASSLSLSSHCAGAPSFRSGPGTSHGPSLPPAGIVAARPPDAPQVSRRPPAFPPSVAFNLCAGPPRRLLPVQGYRAGPPLATGFPSQARRPHRADTTRCQPAIRSAPSLEKPLRPPFRLRASIQSPSQPAGRLIGFNVAGRTRCAILMLRRVWQAETAAPEEFSAGRVTPGGGSTNGGMPPVAAGRHPK